jgi:hypothetical protein
VPQLKTLWLLCCDVVTMQVWAGTWSATGSVVWLYSIHGVASQAEAVRESQHHTLPNPLLCSCYGSEVTTTVGVLCALLLLLLLLLPCRSGPAPGPQLALTVLHEVHYALGTLCGHTPGGLPTQCHTLSTPCACCHNRITLMHNDCNPIHPTASIIDCHMANSHNQAFTELSQVL